MKFEFLKRFGAILRSSTGLQRFAIVFLILFGIYYRPIEINTGFGPHHIVLMALMIVLGVVLYGALSKALWLGIVYCAWQLIVAFSLNDSIRWTTIMYSFGLVFTYVGFYNLVYCRRVFTLESFIEVLKMMMGIAFVFCILQQLAILAGMRSLPVINMMMIYETKGPLACSSIYLEMSHFARFMLVCYYCYVKCSEMKRGKGRYALGELFEREHRWQTIGFLWMMLTMASATAMIALLAFSLYFITRRNAVYMIPLFVAAYVFLQNVEERQLQRSLHVIEATAELDKDTIIGADKSASFRIAPVINSLHADFSKKETWFGHGVDYARNNELSRRLKATMFDDYGVIFLIISYVFAFSCAYKIPSLGALFMIMGIGGGGFGGNIQYGWELAMVMTVLKYFLEQREAASGHKQNRGFGVIYGQ
ncbi:MAG: hypothetical protein MJ025_01310 [Victivallaceae bacterium]|nr:hypothetical protein [Victivallaceae bacterium]